MQLNVLNDLAKAKRRWTEKKGLCSRSSASHMIGFTNAPWRLLNTTQLLQLIRVMHSLGDRPGESQEAMDGKKALTPQPWWDTILSVRQQIFFVPGMQECSDYPSRNASHPLLPSCVRKEPFEPHFVRKVARDAFKIAILPQFLAIQPPFVRNCCDWTSANRNFTAVFGHRTRAKLLRPDPWNRTFNLSFWRSKIVSWERVAFRAVSLALPRTLTEK